MGCAYDYSIKESKTIIQQILTPSTFSFGFSCLTPPFSPPVKLFPCWHSAVEKWNAQQSQWPGYIWVSPVFWHRGVTYPHCTRTGTPLWAPQLHSATSIYSPRLKCDSPAWKITSPTNPLLPALSVCQLVCWHGPQSHLKGKNGISWVTAPVLFPDAWRCAKTSAVGISPIARSTCLTCWKINAIHRVWSSKWSLAKC